MASKSFPLWGDGRAFDGGYAEYTLLPNEQIYPIKTELDLESLIALPETYYTAFGSFLNLKIEEKDSVLVRGATSGVGIAFAKLLKGKFPEIHLAGTSRNLAKEERLKAVGFDQVNFGEGWCLAHERAVR